MKKLALTAMIALLIPSQVYCHEGQAMVPTLKRYIHKAKTWLTDPNNKKKVILSGVGLAALGIGIAASVYIVKTTSIEKALAKANQPFASGILFFKKHDNATYEVLLGKNDVNTWQDFGGMRDWGESSEKTALREATEESCLLWDDLTTLPKGFNIKDTKTYQIIAAAIKNNETFHVDYQNNRGIYRLYLAPVPNGMDTTQFLKNRQYITSHPHHFDVASLTETHDINWFNAQILYDFVKDKKNGQIATLTIDGKDYWIRTKCYGSFTKGLAKLLNK